MVMVVGESAEHIKQTSCKHCAVKLEYTQSEVKQYNGKDYSGGYDGKEWINCPRCGKEVILRSW